MNEQTQTQTDKQTNRHTVERSQQSVCVCVCVIMGDCASLQSNHASVPLIILIWLCLLLACLVEDKGEGLSLSLSPLLSGWLGSRGQAQLHVHQESARRIKRRKENGWRKQGSEGENGKSRKAKAAETGEINSIDSKTIKGKKCRNEGKCRRCIQEMRDAVTGVSVTFNSVLTPFRRSELQTGKPCCLLPSTQQSATQITAWSRLHQSIVVFDWPKKPRELQWSLSGTN